MKANELQIGDWLMTSSGMPRRVMELSGIVEDYIILEDGTESGFHSIPLTAEILERNGWKRIANFANGYWYPSRIIFDLIINDRRGIDVMGDCEVVTCMYVHELQQALRVDGQEELANNFII